MSENEEHGTIVLEIPVGKKVDSEESTDGLCNCEVCKAWRDEENMIEGTFKIPKAAFDAVQKTIPVIKEDNKHLRNSSDSVVLGYALGVGAKNEVGNHIHKTVMEKLGKAISEAFSN
ncbi:hypothetical protein MSHOH_1480 [Methanosarcina horonobensis HB-1 = JCM 15518]|uniref:Uncharacterized protein n=1 Tax=Methanosarcina horonobensis HB-1 = JCM 15518 TaxID=1434110 RepID=A0A0E3SEM5_9EURY|nr:hypothetical protein [Methanosarcina horonobensis]AKB77963.1 hypothetical protein MSHOH_1480 [Methanosarcina horonobensis HB-1 = JCM 15518]